MLNPSVKIIGPLSQQNNKSLTYYESTATLSTGVITRAFVDTYSEVRLVKFISLNTVFVC